MSIYLPTYLTPSVAEARDMSISQLFTAQVNGSVITHYQLKIYNNVSNALLYDSTKLTLSPNLYDKQTLNHTVPANSITNGLELKWTLQVWSGTSTATSREVYFKSYGLPTFSVTVPPTITTKSYNFSGVFTHPQSIGIKKFQFKLYDNNDELIASSGEIYSANTVYNFSDVSFISGNTYKVEGIAEDMNGVIVSSGKQTFTVSYSQPNVTIIPKVSIDYSTSAVKVKWANAIQIYGVSNGTYTYVTNFSNTVNNKALSLDNSSSISWTVDIPEEFTITMFMKFDTTFDGIFIELLNGYQIGYNNEYHRFYYNNNGIIEYKDPQVLTSNPYLIVIRPTDFIIKEIN